MFSTTDTIVAVATPPGRGGIGIVRLSGPHAHAIACRMIARDRNLVPRHATFATVVDDDGGAESDERTGVVAVRGRGAVDGRQAAAIDQVVVTYFQGPASYTGEDVVEIGAHGSPVVLHQLLAQAIRRGARLAEPGEFTLRAFLGGRLDLMQAESVADLIDAVTPLQARAAFDQLNGTLTQSIASLEAQLFDLIARLEASVDFPEEGYHFVEPNALAATIDDVIEQVGTLLNDARRGRLLREGFQLAIVGAPNAGKSSLFNALVGASRAIVTEVPGTTRDLVTETIDLEGFSVTLVDTAGLRSTDDRIESEGVQRSLGAARVADLILHVIDLSTTAEEIDHDLSEQMGTKKRLVVGSKSDLLGADERAEALSDRAARPAIAVSAVTGEGLSVLRRQILQALDMETLADRPAVTNVRHIALLEDVAVSLRRARIAALADGRSLSEEFVLADLQHAQQALEEITGKRTSEDLLAHIFERFCIGK